MPTEKRLSSSHASIDRIEQAYQHVNDFWFPVNPQLLNRIHASIKTNAYKDDCSKIVADIKGDFALFTHCIKQLASMLKKENVPVPANLNPIELLEWSGVERLKKMLEIDESGVSRHALSNINELQTSRLKEAMISASAAEMLAEMCDIDPEMGFSAGLLRQLGYTLISWNYPRIYEKAVSTLKTGNNLDLEISQLLGFSPQLLAATIIRRWGISSETEVCQAFDCSDTGNALEDIQAAEAAGRTLEKICKIGEALARADQPEIYPQAHDDWEIARREIEIRFGENAIEIIGNKVRENCSNYISLVPDLFKAGVVLDPESKLTRYWDEQIQNRNPYVLLCREELQPEFNNLYRNLESAEVSQELVKQLVTEIIPLAGFSAACIYTIDPGLMLLVPQTTVGELKIRNSLPVSYSPYSTDSDLIQLAYKTTQPIVHEHISVNKEIFACLAGVIGFSQRIGVLYVEIPQDIFDAAESGQLPHYKAIVHALNDCLHLH